jgi:hypothetical protein
MAKEKKQLTPGVKASEVDKEILENVGSKPLFNKKAKGGMNKFMKERSGAAVTQKEADRLKKEISRSAVTGAVGEAMGASVTDAERERLEKFMPDKNIDDSDFENKTKAMEGYLKEAQKIKDNSQNYADGGEVVVGKGKDYIKDLL